MKTAEQIMTYDTLTSPWHPHFDALDNREGQP